MQEVGPAIVNIRSISESESIGNISKDDPLYEFFKRFGAPDSRREPTQGMGHEDVELVTQLIKKVAANRTVLMVEHNMNVVSSIADRITVLARGAVIAEGPYAEVSRNPQVLQAYMGSEEVELQGAHG